MLGKFINSQPQKIVGMKPLGNSALPLWIPILFGVVTLIFLPNMGGGALSLPYSLLSWFVVFLIIIWGSYQVILTNKIILSGGFLLLLVAALLLTLPWFWTASPLLKMAALPRFLAIWLSLLTLFALLQGSVSLQNERVILHWLLCVTVIQAILGIAQLFTPHWVNFVMAYDPVKAVGRPYGIFQQYNLFGSFLATGVGLSSYLIMTAPLHSTSSTTHYTGSYLTAILKRHGYSLALFILWTTVIWSQSRIGLLGAVLMTILALMSRFTIKIWLPVIIAIVLGVVLPYTSIWNGLEHGFQGIDLIHEGANFERLSLIIGSLKLILQHPWLGQGLASFETTWLLPKLSLYVASSSFTHPHNELLYTWSEGGIVAVTGFLLIIAIWLSSAIYWSIQRGHFDLKISILRIMLPLPIALHLMTEYPLYQSIPHLLMLLILWRVIWNEKRLRSYQPSRIWKKSLSFFSIVVILGSLFGMISCAGGLYVQHQLTRLEENGLQSVKIVRSLEALPKLLTWTQQQRLEYDSKTQSLLEFNLTGNKQNLLNYVEWGKRYLVLHNDPNVSSAMMLSQQILGQPLEREKIRQQAQLHFPFDARFFPK